MSEQTRALRDGGAAPKGWRSGTHRTVSPAETLAHVRPLMPVMGITRIANVTGLDNVGIPVTMVTRPNARALAVAQGKGLDLAAAQASGLMEAVEAYHAERITLPLKLASYEELRYTHRLVDPEQLPRASAGQLSPYRPIHWVEGHDWLADEPVWAPYDSVHLNLTAGFNQPGSGLLVSSNGLASGNHPLEAISHAICELVERDAMALWYLGGAEAQAASRLELGSVADADCQALLAKFERAGVAVGAWELTSDIGIPTFLCRALDAEDHPLRRRCISEAMGCHPDPVVALQRALTEVAQGRLTWIAGSRDDCVPAHYVAMRDPDLAERQRAILAAPGPRRPFPAASWAGEAFADDVAWELERLRAAGVERVVVVDLTHPAFRIPVVKVVIPGLEGPVSHGAYVPNARARGWMARQP